jgi:protein tyrosine phosphatase
LYKKNARTNFSLIFTFQTGETRTISHFHYTTWPDFGVPESPASFLNFLFKVRESGCLTPDHGPAVIHCSAGIGRSGTFSLVDTCLVLVSVMRSHWCFVLLCFVLSFYNVDDKKINNFA